MRRYAEDSDSDLEPGQVAPKSAGANLEALLAESNQGSSIFFRSRWVASVPGRLSVRTIRVPADLPNAQHVDILYQNFVQMLPTLGQGGRHTLAQ